MYIIVCSMFLSVQSFLRLLVMIDGWAWLVHIIQAYCFSPVCHGFPVFMFPRFLHVSCYGVSESGMLFCSMDEYV